jgi:hypothetical protein
MINFVYFMVICGIMAICIYWMIVGINGWD